MIDQRVEVVRISAPHDEILDLARSPPRFQYTLYHEQRVVGFHDKLEFVGVELATPLKSVNLYVTGTVGICARTRNVSSDQLPT